MQFRGLDLTGQVYGRLVVIERAPKHNQRVMWKCQCSCGQMTVVPTACLRNGESQSCGCLFLEKVQKMGRENTTHGLSGTPEYQSWVAMISRCEDPTHRSYARYGGRGIGVCKRWRASVQAFVADLGPRPSSEHSLERITNESNYEPGKVRWATRKEQARNRSSNRLITFDGKTMCLVEWAEHLNMKAVTIRQRLNRGFPLEVVLNPKRVSKAQSLG
jgi:hypothetical protein